MSATTNPTKPKVTLQPAAVKLLRQIQEKIRKAPTSFDMSVLISKEKKGRIEAIVPLEDNLLPPCGTTACIAGWACLLSGKRPGRSSLDVAAKILGLEVANNSGLLWEPASSDFLFLSEFWPSPLDTRDQELVDDLYNLGEEKQETVDEGKSTAALDRAIASRIKARGALAIKRIDLLIKKGI